ncbi:MAG: antirestriction protein ArdA [Acidimicrobiales bacterium]
MNEEEPREQEHASSEQEPRISPKVWIASLSDYNAGRLHGAWVEADQEPEGIWSAINEVLRTSQVPGAEEWAIFDYEGFGVLMLSEHETVESISRLGRGIGEHGEAFSVYAHFFGRDDEALDQFEDCYIGKRESAAAYVEELLEEFGINRILDEALPKSIRDYVRVDAEAMARNMEYEMSLLSVETQGGVFLFHPG